MTELTFDHGGVDRAQASGSGRVDLIADTGPGAASTATSIGSIFATILTLPSRLAGACRARREKLVEQAMRRPNWIE